MENMEKETCSICMDELKNIDIDILECNHKYHKTCIYLWFNNNKDKNKTCPICRQIDLGPISRELYKKYKQKEEKENEKHLKYYDEFKKHFSNPNKWTCLSDRLITTYSFSKKCTKDDVNKYVNKLFKEFNLKEADNILDDRNSYEIEIYEKNANSRFFSKYIELIITYYPV